jgi:hypothetical protein
MHPFSCIYRKRMHLFTAVATTALSLYRVSKPLDVITWSPAVCHPLVVRWPDSMHALAAWATGYSGLPNHLSSFDCVLKPNPPNQTRNWFYYLFEIYTVKKLILLRFELQHMYAALAQARKNYADLTPTPVHWLKKGQSHEINCCFET